MTRAISLVALLVASPALAQGIGGSPLDGFYVGANVGVDWSKTSVIDTNGGVTPGPFNFSGTNWLGGIQLGYDKALFSVGPGVVVAGIESDLGYMAKQASGVIPSSNPAYHQDATVGGGFYIDLTGRLGVAVHQTFLYGKGGGIIFGGESQQVTTKPGYTPTSNTGFQGWVYGGGIEQGLGNGWSIKVEYLHMDFRHRESSQTSVTDPPIGYVYRNTFGLEADTVKTGFAYKF